MASLSELELQNLRHMLTGYEISQAKMKEYAEATEDTQIKQFFQQGIKSATENKQQLMQFLQQEVENDDAGKANGK